MGRRGPDCDVREERGKEDEREEDMKPAVRMRRREGEMGEKSSPDREDDENESESVTWRREMRWMEGTRGVTECER